MELRDYLRVYWSGKWIIIILVVIATATTAVVAATRPVRSGVSVSFAINRINKETTPDYQFDGYYALQATDLFAQTVTSWFSTPSVLQAVYNKAGLNANIDSAASLTSRFKVKKYSSQNIVVRFTETNDARAAKLASALKSVMEEQASQLNQDASGKSLFAIVGEAPVITPAQPNVLLLSIAAALLSFILGIFLVTARHYLKG